MGGFIKGDVVVIPFPYSNLRGSKRRPALVITPAEGDDLILGAITAQPGRVINSIGITSNDFTSGSLNRNSYVRIEKLFTAELSLILSHCGKLKQSKIDEIINELINFIKS